MLNNSLLLIEKLIEYRSVIIYRWRFAAVATVALLVTFVAIVHMIPDTYEASTTILAHPRKVPEKYVATTVLDEPADRLNLLQQEILSSTRLTEVIQKFGLYQKMIDKHGRDAAVVHMRRQIKIQTNHGSSSGPSAFTLTFNGPNPGTAAAVANELANSFILKNLFNREQQVQGTANFISDELQSARTGIASQEAQISRFRMGHLGEMPEQMSANLQAVAQLQAQYQATADKLVQLEEEEVLIKNSPQSDPALRSGASMDPSTLIRDQLNQEEAHLTDLLTHVTPAHPDVVASKNKIEQLKKQLNNLPNSISGGELRSIETRSEVLERERIHLSAQQADIKMRLDAYQARVDAVPLRQEQLSGLTRDYETARDHYRSLLEKSYAAQMASELESKQDAERFEVLDPASPPEHPSAPNRPLLWAFSAFVAVLGGFGVAYAREQIDSSIKNENQLLKILPANVEFVGVISTIPLADSTTGQRTLQAV